MPVITYTIDQRLAAAKKKAVRQAKIDCLEYGIQQKEIAELTKVVPSAISKQLNNGKMTLDTYLAVQVLKAEREKML